MTDADKKAAATLLNEVEKMAAYILNAKQEIAAIAPDDNEDENAPKKIDHASLELNEVIKATEDATNRIMDEADAIQAIADKLENSPAKEALTLHVANLMEACTFQDITGQRIRKVMRMIEHVEARVGNLVKIFGGALPEGYNIKPIVTGKERADEALMNGPQLGKDAPTQEEIDKLFASL